MVQIGQRAEQIFGAPQDIEWTYRDGCFHLVQSRDITAVMEDRDSASATIRREEVRVLKIAAGESPDKVVLAQNELAEMLPRPTPLSMSMMEAMWASGGSVDLACRTLGLDYHVEEDQPNYLITVFGRLYVDKRQEHARAPKLSSFALRRLEKRADRIENEFRKEFLPDFVRDITLREAIDFDRMTTADIFAALEETYGSFIGATHVAVDIVNVAASIYLEQARKRSGSAAWTRPRVSPVHLRLSTHRQSSTLRPLLDACGIAGSWPAWVIVRFSITSWPNRATRRRRKCWMRSASRTPPPTRHACVACQRFPRGRRSQVVGRGPPLAASRL